MKKAYVVTEGETDIQILKRLLPARIANNATFIDGGGTYGAQSLASSLLAKRRIPVALVLDADANDAQIIHEKQDVSSWMLKQAAVNVPFKVLLAIPSIETVFFQDRPFLEAVTQRKFTDLEWKLAKLQPKEALAGSSGDNLQTFLRHLTQESIKAMQEHPLIYSLIEFLSSVIEKDTQQAA